MATIIEVCNPFKPMDGAVAHQHAGGLTIRQWLDQRHNGFKEFQHPTICFTVDVKTGKHSHFLRSEWETYVIKPGDNLTFAVIHGDAITLFWALLVVSVVAAVIMVSNMPKPILPGQQKAPDNVYSLTGQQNQNRLGFPVEDCYGRNRLYPSYGAASYNEYQGNNQYLYQLFCLGLGEYDVSEEDALKIEDTPIGAFEGIEYEFYGPGEEVTLFPDNVVTVAAISAKELYGPNEVDYEFDDTGVELGDVGQNCTSIDVDIIINGLYVSNTDGSLGNATITAAWDYRLAGSSDDWIPLFRFEKTLNTNTPQRYTVKTPVALGRYEVRANRTNPKNEDARAGNTLIWQAVRVFLPSTKVYQGVTMLAVKALATNNLNDNAASRINVIATRKLPVYESNAPGPLTATRSIPWALMNIANATYGGRLSLSQINLVRLRELEAIYEARGDCFDCVFSDRITTWEALKTCARAGRAIPMISGSVLTVIRDEPRTIPTMLFNQENIVDGSFQIEMKLPGVEDNDGIEIVYVDEDTFREETLLCYFTGDAGEDAEDEPVNPERIDLRGVTVRNQAYHEGMYLWAQKRYLTTNLSLKTGLEGQLPAYNDLVAISHDLPRWATGGMVESIDVGTMQVELSEPVTFGAGVHKIAFKKKNGGVLGPFTATAVTGDHYAVVVAYLTDDDDPETGIENLVLDDYNERPVFNFGTSADWAKFMTVVGITPTSAEEVGLKLINYDERVFAYDEVDAPALPVPTVPPLAPALPAVVGLTVLGVPDSVTSVIAAWDVTLGAVSYYVEKAVKEQFTITGGTVEADDDIYTKTAHNLDTGDPVKLLSLTGGGGLTAGRTYFFIRLTANTGKFALTKVASIDGTPVDVLVDATDVVLSTVPDESDFVYHTVTNGTNTSIPVSPGYLHVRVAGRNTGQGPWAYWQGSVGAASAPPGAVKRLSLSTAFVGNACEIKWNDLPAAETYTVVVYHTTGMVELETYEDIEDNFFSYTATMHAANCAALSTDRLRNLTFKVYAVNEAGTGPAATLSGVINPEPEPIVGLGYFRTGSTWAEKAVAAGTISGSGNARATITSTFVTGSPVNVDFAVTAGDTPAVWAGLARAAIALDAAVAAKFTVSGTGTDIILTGKDGVFYDSTFNIALADQTSIGVTAAPTSTDVSANTYQINWTPSVETDILEYRVYGKISAGVTTSDTLIASGLITGVGFSITKTAGAHGAYYWMVAVLDKWGLEVEVSAEATILAYP